MKVGSTNSARSRCRGNLFKFFKVPRAFPEDLSTFLLGRLVPLALFCGSTTVWRGENDKTNRPIWMNSKLTNPTSVRLLCLSGWIPRRTRMLGGQLHPQSPCVVPSTSFTWDFLRRPGATFSVSAIVSKDSQMFPSRDGWIVALLLSLWWTRGNIYMIWLQHIA